MKIEVLNFCISEPQMERKLIPSKTFSTKNLGVPQEVVLFPEMFHLPL